MATVFHEAQDCLCNEHFFVSSQDIAPFSCVISCWATEQSERVTKRMSSDTASLDWLTDQSWLECCASLRAGPLSCPASGAMFAGLESAVALASYLVLTPVLSIDYELLISRCLISLFVRFPLFPEVFFSTFLPLRDGSICGWIDKVPSRLSAFSFYNWSLTCHSSFRGILTHVTVPPL